MGFHFAYIMHFYSHDMTSDDWMIVALATAAIVSTAAFIWVRKNVPPNLPPNEAVSAALQKLAYRGSKPPSNGNSKTPKEASKEEIPPVTPPEKDQPNLGGNFSGGFGSGIPFLDGLPGMGEPQPVTTDVTFNVSHLYSIVIFVLFSFLCAFM